MRRRILPLVGLVACAMMLPVTESAAKTMLVTFAEKAGKDIGKPNPDEALIVFIRPSKLAPAIAATIHERKDDGSVEMVTTMYTRTYMVHRTKPGKHIFTVVSEAADFIEVDAKAGKIYPVMVVPRMGAWKARFSMLPGTPGTEFWPNMSEYLEESRKVVPNEKAGAWFEENKTSVLEKTAAYWPKWIARPERPILTEGTGLDDL